MPGHTPAAPDSRLLILQGRGRLWEPAEPGSLGPDAYCIASAVWAKNPYNNAHGETHPTCGDLDVDGADELLFGLGSRGAGWLELRDDLAFGLRHLDWWRATWPDYNSVGGLTRPALAR